MAVEQEGRSKNMPNMLCIACTVGDDIVEFPTVADYVTHTKGGHISRPVKTPPPPTKPPSLSATELKAQQEGTQKVTELPTSPVTDDTPLVKPLLLTYKWTGVHQPCNTEPKTIALDLAEGQVGIIAYCFHCDKKLAQLNVPILPQLTSQKMLIPKTSKKRS